MHPHEHHAALATLFEISDVAGRADLKVEMIKELERQRNNLALLKGNPQIDMVALNKALSDLGDAQRNIADIHGKVSQYLTDNEWLSNLRSRIVIPGGTCEFDLPAYHAWLRTDGHARGRDIEAWAKPFLPLRDGTELLLRLLRSTSRPTHEIAVSGNYQQTLTGKSYQLMRVVFDNTNLVPEISANKYMLWIRVIQCDGTDKPKYVESSVPFHLTLCAY